jgi:single stranded DNA-binding protein
MASFNKIQLTGKLTDAPDVKATTSGHSLAKFTLIVPRVDALPNARFDYIRVVTWRETADKVKNFKKDDVLYVEGRIITDSYEEAATGQRKWTTEVDARQVINYNEVFTDGISANPVAPSTDTTSFTAPSPTSTPTETLPIQPVDESDFFKTPSVNDTENELEEDVPF